MSNGLELSGAISSTIAKMREMGYVPSSMPVEIWCHPDLLEALEISLEAYPIHGESISVVAREDIPTIPGPWGQFQSELRLGFVEEESV